MRKTAEAGMTAEKEQDKCGKGPRDKGGRTHLLRAFCHSTIHHSSRSRRRGRGEGGVFVHPFETALTFSGQISFTWDLCGMWFAADSRLKCSFASSSGNV